MKIYYDTEFLENGWTIDLISIGMVTEDGKREYYAVSAEFDQQKVWHHKWLRQHVVWQLPLRPEVGTDLMLNNDWLDLDDPAVKVRSRIADEVRDFIRATPNPELWAYYGAYDHVALAQLWGRMIDLPNDVPMWTNDLKQEALRLGNPQLPEQAAGEHNALADARHNRIVGQFLAAFDRKEAGL